MSHIAIVLAHPDYGTPILCESTTLCREPCVVTGRRTRGLQCHEISSRVLGFRGGVWLYRLVTPLSDLQSRTLIRYTIGNLGRGIPYDLPGAVGSRTLGLGWLQRLLLRSREDLTSLFCSEWCAAALRTVGVFAAENASRYSPNCLVRELIRKGICQRPINFKRELSLRQRDLLASWRP